MYMIVGLGNPKKEYENTLTLEEFNEGEKLIKEHRETLLVEIIESNTDECLEQAVADTGGKQT